MSKKDTGPLAELKEAFLSGNTPVVYLYGKEPFLIRQGVDFLRETLLDPSTKDLNLHLLQGRETSASEILQVAQTLPMLAKHRLLLVYEADKIPAQELNQLVPYLENPNPTSCVCFVAETADARLKFISSLKKEGLLLKLDPLSTRQLPAFIQREASLLGIKFSREAIDFMVEVGGSDLGQLRHMLEQLSCFAHDRLVQVTDVELFVGSPQADSVFDLIDAVASQDKPKALVRLEQLLREDEPALRMLTLLVRHTRHLWQIRSLLNGKTSLSPTEIAQSVGVPPFVAVKLLAQARALSSQQIESIQEALFQTEQSIKNSRISDTHHMEHLVLTICEKQKHEGTHKVTA